MVELTGNREIRASVEGKVIPLRWDHWVSFHQVYILNQIIHFNDMNHFYGKGLEVRAFVMSWREIGKCDGHLDEQAQYLHAQFILRRTRKKLGRVDSSDWEVILHHRCKCNMNNTKNSPRGGE